MTNIELSDKSGVTRSPPDCYVFLKVQELDITNLLTTNDTLQTLILNLQQPGHFIFMALAESYTVTSMHRYIQLFRERLSEKMGT